jgi:hypothetical protein
MKAIVGTVTATAAVAESAIVRRRRLWVLIGDVMLSLLRNWDVDLEGDRCRHDRTGVTPAGAGDLPRITDVASSTTTSRAQFVARPGAPRIADP